MGPGGLRFHPARSQQVQYRAISRCHYICRLKTTFNSFPHHLNPLPVRTFCHSYYVHHVFLKIAINHFSYYESVYGPAIGRGGVIFYGELGFQYIWVTAAI